MDQETERKLIDLAIEAREQSYSPYSGFMVGAALLASDGNIYTGCNIENASFGASICAERTAAAKAVSCGSIGFEAIAIAGARKDAEREDWGYSYPCGICRQFLSEFALPGMEFMIIGKDVLRLSLDDLLPCSFGAGNLKEDTDV